MKRYAQNPDMVNKNSLNVQLFICHQYGDPRISYIIGGFETLNAEHRWLVTESWTLSCGSIKLELFNDPLLKSHSPKLNRCVKHE